MKILLLEDDPEDVDIIQHIIQENIPGVDYYFAANKNAYLRALSEIQPDCILADNSVTGMNAGMALATAREQLPEVPFIMVTGAVPETYAIDMIKAGADDYIIKDRLQRLPAAIKAAMNKYRAAIELKSNVEKLKENEEKYRTLVERVSDGFIALDKDFRYTYLNRQAGELVHKDPAELIGEKIWDVFPDAIGSETYNSFLRAMEEQVYVCSIDCFPPLDTWHENHIYPSPEGISVFVRDITEVRRSEQKMRKMEKEIMHQQIQEQKKIARAIIHAQEQERNRIGQELHDNVNQILAATKMFLSSAAKSDAAREAIRYPIQLIDNSIEEIRSLSSRQVTPLMNIHLKEMIEELIDKMKASAKLTAVLDYNDHEDQMDDDLKLNVYRIIQEQVNNIVKYAAAKNVLISIRTEKDGTHILISDDGKGFDTTKKRKGIGISNMINRVEAFNGSINIHSAPGMGCRVSFTIPVTVFSKNLKMDTQFK